MPYTSDKQRRFFHTATARRAGITPDMVREYDEATRGKTLPDTAKQAATSHPSLPSPSAFKPPKPPAIEPPKLPALPKIEGTPAISNIKEQSQEHASATALDRSSTRLGGGASMPKTT